MGQARIVWYCVAERTVRLMLAKTLGNIAIRRGQGSEVTSRGLPKSFFEHCPKDY